MVLDNSDNAGVLLGPLAMSGEARSAQWRMDYNPSCDHGSIIITTRSKGEALRLVYEGEILEVLPMSEDEAETLLESKLGHSDLDSHQLALALDCMPLAITQAAAYILERAPRCSVGQYWEEMEQSRTSRTSLLRRDMPLPSRDAEASNSVLLTWQISFEYVYKTRSLAVDLLLLMSLCDRLAIPETFVQSDTDCTEDADSAELSDEKSKFRGRHYCAVQLLVHLSNGRCRDLGNALAGTGRDTGVARRPR